jgi:hypothetical protein
MLIHDVLTINNHFSIINHRSGHVPINNHFSIINHRSGHVPSCSQSERCLHIVANQKDTYIFPVYFQTEGSGS